jgi:3-oxo-5-alpha-steroid 4-dehydrogenase 3
MLIQSRRADKTRLTCNQILAVDNLSPLRDRFIVYGSREIAPAPRSEEEYNQAPLQLPEQVHNLLNRAAKIRVPHAWFSHFYALSLMISCFWAQQILSDGRAFELFAVWEAAERRTSMTLDQAMLAWAMMTFQAGRRLYECLDNYKPSASRMWLGHWLAGLAFYAAMGLAVWIEASRTSPKVRAEQNGVPMLMLASAAILMSTKPTLRSLHIDPPSLRTFIGLPIFVLASGIQHDIHSYLAALKKYSLPQHPMFAACICPHYLCECFIYLSLAIIAAPMGTWLNWTILSGLIFVSINLGITAKGTRKWYARKFKDERIMFKACMIPGII